LAGFRRAGEAEKGREAGLTGRSGGAGEDNVAGKQTIRGQAVGKSNIKELTRGRSDAMKTIRLLLTAMVLLLASYAVGAEKKPAPPSDPAQASAPQVLDAATCRDTALAAEQARDWLGALDAWERVIDRCAATEAQRIEARTHIKELRPKVSRNTDPQKARPWKILVVIFRQLDFSWKDGEKTVEVHKTINADDEKKIRKSVEDFGKHVFHHSSGMLRVDADFAVVDEPLTKMEGTGKGPFCPAPRHIRPFTDPLLKGKQYDTVFSYVKFNGDKGPDVPAPWIAATYASLGEMGGAGYVDVAWHTNYPFPGEASGEMELHEWLHQVDWMFHNVLHYSDDVVPSSDAGRFEGEKRPGGDPEYGRTPTETTWMRFYKHIMEDHITRQMWSEATMRVPPGKH
jgi:hypothetical protein